jgi:hypothetical protein
MLSMRKLLPILLLAATLACNTGRRTVAANAPQAWFHITLGLTDADPTDWSDSRSPRLGVRPPRTICPHIG